VSSTSTETTRGLRKFGLSWLAVFKNAKSTLLKVRDATAEDAERIRDVHVETWEATYRPLVPSGVVEDRLRVHQARDWAHDLAEQASAGGGMLVLTDGEAVLGFCHYGRTDSEDEDPALVGEIHRLYVALACQGQGGGKLLLSAATGLRLGGCLAAVIWLFGADARARCFYQHMGWRPDDVERHDDGMTDNRYRMSLLSTRLESGRELERGRLREGPIQ
jgi:GNAT superfamily N-acetyltransferase